MALLVLISVLTICFSALTVFLLKTTVLKPPIQELDFQTSSPPSTKKPETIQQRLKRLRKKIKQNIIRKLESKDTLVTTVYTGNPREKGTEYNRPDFYECYPYQNSYDYSKKKAPNHSTFFVVDNPYPDSKTPPFTQISLPVLTLNYVYYVINVSNSPCYLYYGQNIKQIKKKVEKNKNKLISRIEKRIASGGSGSGGSGSGGSGSGGKFLSGGGSGLPRLLPRLRSFASESSLLESFETPSEDTLSATQSQDPPTETPSEDTPSGTPYPGINYVLQNVLLTTKNALVLQPNTFAILINIVGGYCLLSSTQPLYPISIEVGGGPYTPTPYPESESTTQDIITAAPKLYSNNIIYTLESLLNTDSVKSYESPKNIILNGIPPIFYNYINVSLTTQSTICCLQNTFQEKSSDDNFLSLPYMDMGSILYVQNDNTFNNLILMYEGEGFYTNYGYQDVVVMGGNSFVMLIYTTDRISVVMHENIILNDTLSPINSQYQCQGTYGYCKNTGIHYCSTQCYKTATCPMIVLTESNHMSIGGTLNLCGKLVSQNQKYTLILQSNGNIVIYPSSSIGNFTNVSPPRITNSISTVNGNAVLNSCESISSDNGMYELYLQSNGVLTLYSTNGDSSVSDCKVQDSSSIVWSSQNNNSVYTSTNTITNPFLTIQSDNNLVLYGYINGSSQKSVLWSANTENTKCDTVQVFNTGKFVAFESTTGYVFYDSSNTSYNANDSASATPLTSIFVNECNYESSSESTVSGEMIWSTGTSTSQISNISLVFEDDGNLCLYVGYNSVNPYILWSSQTSTTGSDTVVLTNDGILIIYNSQNGRVYFASSVGTDASSANNDPSNYSILYNTIPSTTTACRSFPNYSVSIMNNFSLQNPSGDFLPNVIIEFTGKLPAQLDYVDIPLPSHSILRLPFKVRGIGHLMITLPVYGKVYNGTIYYVMNQNNFSDIIVKCPTYGTFSNFEGMTNQDTIVVSPTEYIILIMLQQSWYVVSMSFLDGNIMEMQTMTPSSL